MVVGMVVGMVEGLVEGLLRFYWQLNCSSKVLLRKRSVIFRVLKLRGKFTSLKALGESEFKINVEKAVF